MSVENPVTGIYFGGPLTHEIQTQNGPEARAYGGVIFLDADPQIFLEQVGQRLQSLSASSSGSYRARVSTDEIIRVPHLLTTDLDSLGGNALCGLPPEYGVVPETFKNLQGTVLVAGEQFGRGSSREQAVIALQKAGFTAVFAPSFGPIFERNAISLGLHLSTNLALAEKVQRGEPVPLAEFLAGKSEMTQAVIRAGGLFPYVRGINAGKIEKPTIPERVAHPMNVFEKRLSRRVGTPIQPGDDILLTVDMAASYVVLSGLGRAAILQEYGQVVSRLDNILLFEDHFANSTHEGVLALTAEQREFAQELGIPPQNYFRGLRRENGGAGIIHRVLLEKVDPRTAQVVTVTDSHTPTAGALPILAIPIGSTEFGVAVAEGLIPFSAPSVLRVDLKGKLPLATTIRDAQIEMAARFRQMKSSTKVIEFGGEGLNNLTFSNVAALCNMVPEVFNAEIAVTEVFEAGIKYLEERWGISRAEALALYGTPDPNCEYADIFEFDLSQTSPWIAKPGDPSNGVSLSQLEDHPRVDKAYIASCTNGLEELREAAAVMMGQTVAAGTQFIIIPSSQAVYDEAERLEYLQILRDAGAIVQDDIVCGPCIGDGDLAVQAGQTAISATNRNFPRRMGAGDVYLAGSILVALAAQLGHIPTIEEYQDHLNRTEPSIKL